MCSSANKCVKKKDEIYSIRLLIILLFNKIKSHPKKKYKETAGLTMNHFWSHPVRVAHNRVSLPPVWFLHTLELPQFVLVLVFYH